MIYTILELFYQLIPTLLPVPDICKGKFLGDSEKVFFAILYLWGIALDYFEPFINEPNTTQYINFLEEQNAFIQKLSNIFGSYSLEDNDEDAIVAIPFPTKGKAINYFIYFAKYQNRIRWDNHSLRKVIKDAILTRIRDELHYSKEDLSTFEDLKQAVLKIDNDHWKYTQDKQSKQYLVCSLQTHLPRLSRPDYFYPSASDGKTPAE